MYLELSRDDHMTKIVPKIVQGQTMQDIIQNLPYINCLIFHHLN
jgi:hypothetical protein